MRKNVFGRQLKRDKNERKALFKGLMSSLVLHERIKTTEAKAKAIKGSIEKLVTIARKNNALVSRRMVTPYLSNVAIEKFLTDVALRFEGRPGGYTRIMRLDTRLKDNAPMVLLEWVEGPSTRSKAESLKIEKEIKTKEKAKKPKKLKQKEKK